MSAVVTTRYTIRKVRKLGALAAVAMALMLAAGCTTSGSPTSTRATSKEINAFLKLAEKGLNSKFIATYRTVGTNLVATGGYVTSITTVQDSSSHFKYAASSRGVLEWVFFGALQSSYSVPKGTGQIYTCQTEMNRATWSCSQVGPGNLGGILMGGYLPLNVLSGLQTLVEGFNLPGWPHVAYLSRKIAAGLQLTCLNFGPELKPSATVCLTTGGIIGYYSSHVEAASEPLGTTSLVSLSFHVTKGDLTLPAKATASPGA